MSSVRAGASRLGFSLRATAVILAITAVVVFLALPPAQIHLEVDPAVASAGTVVSGALHVHSVRSDGSGTPDEIAAAAADAGLDFVVLTDHGDGTRAPDPPAYRHGVLCLDGVEISTSQGHYLALDMPRSPYRLGGEARDVVEDVSRLGGFGVAAHPDSTHPELAWAGWDEPFPALEWVNGDSEWRDESRTALARGVIAYPFRPVETLVALLDTNPTLIARWDGLTEMRPVVALPGHDAHARFGTDESRRGIALAWPSYVHMFRALSLHVELATRWTGDPETDARRLITALRQGRAFTVVDGLATPATFRMRVTGNAGSVGPGGTLDASGPLSLDVRSNAPAGARVRVVRNGRIALEQEGPNLQVMLPAGEGPVRVEVFLERPAAAVPWILTNPVYIRSPDNLPPEEGASDAQAASTAEGADPDVSTWPWTVESSPSSTGSLVTDDAARWARLNYRLSAGDESPYVALIVPLRPELVTPPGGTATGASGAIGGDRGVVPLAVSFRGRASAPMRVSVQLRGLGPSGAEQRWRRSVYLDEEARDVRVPVAEMTVAAGDPAARPADPSLGPLDLLFVVDTLHTVPGAAGTFTIDRVGLPIGAN